MIVIRPLVSGSELKSHLESVGARHIRRRRSVVQAGGAFLSVTSRSAGIATNGVVREAGRLLSDRDLADGLSRLRDGAEVRVGEKEACRHQQFARGGKAPRG